MKIKKKIILMSIITLLFEISGLVYLNNYYLGDTNTFNIQKVNSKTAFSNKKMQMEIPEDASKISVSYNGNFVSYLQNDSLKIYNFQTKNTDTVSLDDDSEDNLEVNYYTWVPDRNRILIASKYTKYSSLYYKLYSYDVEKQKLSNINDDYSNELKILMPNNNYCIKQAVMSTLTNVIYVSAEDSTNNMSNRIYRINIMGSLNKVKHDYCVLGKIGIMTTKDELFYEDVTNNSIKSAGYTNISIDSDITNPSLLGTDNNDNIYVCSKDEDANVNEINVMTLDENGTKQINTYSLPEAIQFENIYLSVTGDILINDSKNNTVFKLNNTSDKIKFKGEFLQPFNKGIVYINNSTLYEEIFK